MCRCRATHVQKSRMLVFLAVDGLQGANVHRQRPAARQALGKHELSGCEGVSCCVRLAVQLVQLV